MSNAVRKIIARNIALKRLDVFVSIDSIAFYYEMVKEATPISKQAPRLSDKISSLFSDILFSRYNFIRQDMYFHLNSHYIQMNQILKIF